MERRAGGNIKKLLLVINLVLLMVNSGCMNILHQGERPDDYPPAKWVSTTPDVWFVVDSSYTDATGSSELSGKMNLDGQAIDIEVWFDYFDTIYVSKAERVDYPKLFIGTCTFSPDKLVVKVKEDLVYRGEYEEITFIRIPIDE